MGGYAFGTASAPALRPWVQDFANFAWSLHRVRPLGIDTVAAMQVEGVWTPERARLEASYTGYSDGRLDALVQLVDDPPALAYLFELWRRDEISAAKFQEALQHHRIESDYFGPLRQLHNVLLTPGELAQARQRGFVDQARQYSEAELQGVTNERAEIQFKSAGLPPPTERALSMWRRGIITEAEFKQTIVEGNEKLKYQDEEAALYRPLLTPATIVNQRLRGWRDTPWMNARLAEHGYSTEQANDLFQGQGRPISTRQVFIGERRGGVYNGPTAGIEPAILKQLQESNIRPEWYHLADAQKESYPSAFVIRQLATSGAIDPTQTHRVLMEIGWPVWLIDAVVAAWTGGAAGAPATDARVKSAVTAAVSEIRSAYILGQADAAAVRGWLDRLGVTVAGELLPIWDVMREVPQTGLTAAQIKKAFKKTLYTRERAIAELQERGMTTEDAVIYLDE